MRKIEEFSSMSDEEYKAFEKDVFKYGKEPYLKDKSFFEELKKYTAEIEAEFKEKKDAEKVSTLEKITDKIVAGGPYIAYWVSMYDKKCLEHVRMFNEKIKGERFALATEVNGEEGELFLMTFDSDACKKEGMVTVHQGDDKFLCSDGTFYGPSMRILQ